ncbi:vWA domain-containing protein [Desulfoferrobacter suflitae]|uniref:vWA domain-containing protein n=1 Tax=Desulfoferrobacter suflitae TaxID=2865782 RepID=UPI002164B71A|nr:VWA domain-containing protein [Desulfoferrobacter suflitae]MCK8600841.1 VWA domain-containing protein [Desulfoferrobacter suflitae]
MDRAIEDFVLVLRRSGVAVSTSETLDAVRAVENIGYSDREVLRGALAATLAKSPQNRVVFDRCFERFFSTGLPPGEPNHGHRQSGEELYGELSQLSQMVLNGDRGGLAIAMQRASREVNVSNIRFVTQKSAYTQKILRRMGFQELNRDILAAGATEESVALYNRLSHAKNELFRMVRNHVEEQLDLYALSASHGMLEHDLADTRLSHVEERDFARMHAIVRKLAAKLNTVYSRKCKAAKRGRLDFKKTLRGNIAHQGCLFATRWKMKKIDRPNVVAICDISRSVQTVSRFFLLFLYALTEMLAQIRTFVFCSNLVEVSDIFDKHSLTRAISMIESGDDLGIGFGLTDYGRALADFKRKHLAAVSQKTTVILIGDARNNYDDPNVESLKLIRQKSRKLFWLNVENRRKWGSGDSEMLKYLPCCDLAMECNTLRHLEKFAHKLLKVRP